MKISEIVKILDAEVVCCDGRLDTEIKAACGSDMMSDVLAYVKDQGLLLTGLVNPQVVRTAEMMDILCICFVRGKLPDRAITELAESKGIVLMATGLRMYEACGKLYAAGLSGGDAE